MKKLIARWTNDSPKFFKKIQIIGVTLVGIGAFIAAVPVALPVAIVTAGGYLATAGGAIALIAKMTVADNACLLPKDEPVL